MEPDGLAELLESDGFAGRGARVAIQRGLIYRLELYTVQACREFCEVFWRSFDQ